MAIPHDLLFSTKSPGTEATLLSGVRRRWPDGYVELLDNALQTVDFVRFGQSAQNHQTTGALNGSATTAIPSNASSYGASLVRPHPISQDTHSAADWTVVNFSTRSMTPVLAVPTTRNLSSTNQTAVTPHWMRPL